MIPKLSLLKIQLKSKNLLVYPHLLILIQYNLKNLNLIMKIV